MNTQKQPRKLYGFEKIIFDLVIIPISLNSYYVQKQLREDFNTARCYPSAYFSIDIRHYPANC